MPRLILGSSSPRRLDLLKQIGIIPDIVKGPDINEDVIKGERPDRYCMRIALEKAQALQDEFRDDFVITADTTCAVGRRIIGKPEDRADAERIMRLLSGRSHIIHTAVAVKGPGKEVVSRLSSNRVTIKRLSDDDVKLLLDSNDWDGCAGGYKMQGQMGRFIKRISGTHTGIIGLPLYETAQLLHGSGYKIDTISK